MTMVKPPDFTPKILVNRNNPRQCCAGIAGFAGRCARHNAGMHPPTQRYRRCFLQFAGSDGLLAAPSPFAAFAAEGGAAGYLPSLLPRAGTVLYGQVML